jgi:uncharacterized protein YjbK
MKPETLTITLKRPAKVGDVEYATLTLVEPTAGQMEEAASNGRVDNGTSFNIALIALVGNIPITAARSLLKTDYDKAVIFLSGFTSDAPSIGDES